MWMCSTLFFRSQHHQTVIYPVPISFSTFITIFAQPLSGVYRAILWYLNRSLSNDSLQIQIVPNHAFDGEKCCHKLYEAIRRMENCQPDRLEVYQWSANSRYYSGEEIINSHSVDCLSSVWLWKMQISPPSTTGLRLRNGRMRICSWRN